MMDMWGWILVVIALLAGASILTVAHVLFTQHCIKKAFELRDMEARKYMSAKEMEKLAEQAMREPYAGPVPNWLKKLEDDK